MLLRNGADPTRPCIGSHLDGDNLFDKEVCVADVQVLLDADSAA